jgi:IPT/TIG domain
MQHFTTKPFQLSILLTAAFVLLNSCSKNEVPIPTITQISPNEGIEGSSVNITGTNFSVSASDNIVQFNGTMATVLSYTATSIGVTVPVGAVTGKVSVTVNGHGTATSSVDFVIDKNPGVIEKFYKLNTSTITIEPINGTKLEYTNSAATKRGMSFHINKEMRVKAIGGMFRKPGDYYFELIDASYTFQPSSVLYSATVSVNTTDSFVFADVGADIRLKAQNLYLLRYCDPSNHTSVYDMWLPSSSNNGSISYVQPFNFGILTMHFMTYDYLNACAPSYFDSSHFLTGSLLMRGIVDLKLEDI